MTSGTVGPGVARATRARVRLDPEQRRAQLLAVGMEMLATRPLDEVSIEEIAEAAGVSRGLLFHYFPSKREYHLAVAGQAAAELLARTDPDPSLPPLERLLAAIEQFVDYVVETRATYLTFVAGVSGADPALHAVFDATRQENADRLVGALVEIGARDTPRLRVGARAWVAFVEEATVHAVARGDLVRDELIDLISTVSISTIEAAVGDPQFLTDLVGPGGDVGDGVVPDP